METNLLLAAGRNRERKRRRVQARAVALLAFTLMAMPAVGDIIWPDIDVVGPNDFLDYQHHRPTDYTDRDDSRIDEVFPIKHRCSEVRVPIHAQRRTVERMIESCKALKWADDRWKDLLSEFTLSEVIYYWGAWMSDSCSRGIAQSYRI